MQRSRNLRRHGVLRLRRRLLGRRLQRARVAPADVRRTRFRTPVGRLWRLFEVFRIPAGLHLWHGCPLHYYY